jgi:hypothetical protein
VEGSGSDAAREFAALWRTLLDEQISQGCSLETAAEATYEQAVAEGQPKDGTSGFAFLNAITILSHALPNGRDLRRWHNEKRGV